MIKVEEIRAKALSQPDEDGDISFAIKALVHNNSDSERVSVGIQGLDNDGFEIYFLYLSGNVPTGESRSLTTKEDYVDASIFNQILLWQQK